MKQKKIEERERATRAGGYCRNGYRNEYLVRRGWTGARIESGRDKEAVEKNRRRGRQRKNWKEIERRWYALTEVEQRQSRVKSQESRTNVVNEKEGGDEHKQCRGKVTGR